MIQTFGICTKYQNIFNLYLVFAINTECTVISKTQRLVAHAGCQGTSAGEDSPHPALAQMHIPLSPTDTVKTHRLRAWNCPKAAENS